MRKIPTLFRRDPDDMRRVLPEVTPGCEWVLDGEGVATRKYDGTCVMLDDDGRWWARREVKPSKSAPAGWVQLECDPATGKAVGWEPIGQSPFSKFHTEALNDPHIPAWSAGTYELCGPKINGNPEGFPTHVLIRHGEFCLTLGRIKFVTVREYLLADSIEGIVWHHSDGRMAKLKRRDFSHEQQHHNNERSN